MLFQQKAHPWGIGKHVILNSPNSCLQHGVLAMNLINWLGYARFASRRRPSLLSHVSSAVQNLDSVLLRMLLGPRKNPLWKVRHRCPDPWVAHFCHTSLLIFTFWKYAIFLRPLLSSKSSKNDSKYKHSWSVWFLSWSLNIVFSSKTYVIISIFGVPDFWLDRLNFRIFIFPTEILKFWYVRRFIDFVYNAESLYFQWKRLYFGTFTDSSFSTTFHFCYTSLLIFIILMLIFENLNISKDQWQKWAPAYQPVSQPAS